MITSKIDTTLTLSDLYRLSEQWLEDCQLHQHSERTVEVRRDFLNRFLWFLNKRGYPDCSAVQLRAFLRYLTEAHKEHDGRWDNPHNTKPLRPITIKDYHVCLKCWFNWMLKEGIIEESPMARVPAPLVRADQKEPLSLEQIESLLEAARRSVHAVRDEAIVSLLLDTGIRASELCELKVKDLSSDKRSFRVHGKGNKMRVCFMGEVTSDLIARHLKKEKTAAKDPLFISDRFKEQRKPFSRSGLLQLLNRLSEAAGIYPLVSVHQMRRTFAVTILRNGANLPSVQRLMGHTTLAMTQRYLLLAQADIEAQHRAYSPRDNLKLK